MLQEWARELDIATDEGKPEAEEGVEAAEVPPGADACIRAVAVKGFAPLEGLADALASNREVVRPIADQLVADGLAATTAGAYRLTEAGKVRAGELLQAERDAWGAEAAAAALDVFLDLDHRVKDTVTAWQIRDAETLNDHLNADYDKAVLDRLEALHDDAVTWLTPLESACPRLGGYRLGAAHVDPRSAAARRRRPCLSAARPLGALGAPRNERTHPGPTRHRPTALARGRTRRGCNRARAPAPKRLRACSGFA